MGVDLADMQSLSKYKKGIKYLLCAIDLFSKYAWVVPLKDKRGISIVNAFQKITSKRKPNKIWIDQGGEFYNKLFKRFLKINNTEIFCNFLIQLFPTTVLWARFVKFATEYVSNISLATPK